MPFVLGLLAYLVGLVRRPIDRRLKQRHVGSFVVVAGAVAVTLLWWGLAPEDIHTAYLLGELAGVLSVYLMAWTIDPGRESACPGTVVRRARPDVSPAPPHGLGSTGPACPARSGDRLRTDPHAR